MSFSAEPALLLVLGLLLVALAFEYINGFLDTANSIATVVCTRVMTPRQAVVMSAVFNLAGALAGTAVATTVGTCLVDGNYVTLHTILCALLSAVIWNLIVWRLGLPSSSSHALIGGLCGATVATAHGELAVIRWCVFNHSQQTLEGIWPKVILPMMASPVIGFAVGFLAMGLLVVCFRKWRPWRVNFVFGKAQLLSASWMSFSHGTNDAQKTMGVIALTLFTASRTGTFDRCPPWLHFLYTPYFHIPLWVKVICAVTMAAGTAVGGWRIIRTVGQKIVRLQPVHGFAAQTTAATVIQVASHFGIPLSTTHICSTSIMGVGATKRFSAVKWGVVGHIVGAWVLTLPITAAMGYGLLRLLQITHQIP
jgi:PiT family inorganic phosphate transporter